MKLKYKKLTMSILGVLITFAGNELGIEKDVIAMAVTLIGTFVLGQGIADHGKEKAKVEKGL